jgi:hypothetical protein
MTALHRAVREGLASGDASVPRHLAGEVQRYLGCGQLRRGFVEVKCEACREVTLVAFSCKGRGLCPSCTTRRAVETGAELAQWLPAVDYRQWTLSLPVPLRWAALRTKGFLPAVERELVHAVWRRQRAEARRLGAEGPLTGGAVAFLQLFGGALQVHPHFHVLLPEGLWQADGTFVDVPPPDDAAVEAVLHRVLRRLRPRLAALEEARPDEDDAALQEAATQRVLLDVPKRPPPRGRRLAVAHGFSLHADTATHAHDRQGLEMLARYGARGAVAESRLRRLEDGRYEYRPKRGPPVAFTAAKLLLRLLALVPPRGLHLTRYQGVFTPNAKLRSAVALERPAPPPPQGLPGTCAPLSPGLRPPSGTTTPPAEAPTPGLSLPSPPPRRPRLNWAAVQARTYGDDVFKCPCGGRRAVVAVVTNPTTADEMLRNLGLVAPRLPLPAAQGPPQLSLAV